MKSIVKLVLALSIVCLVLLGTLKHVLSPKPQQPIRHIALGFWTEGLFDAKNQTLHPETLTSLEKALDTRLRISHFYTGWEHVADEDFLRQVRVLQSHNWIPMVSSNPYYYSECPAGSLPLYRAIASGKCDMLLHKMGRNLKNLTKPIYFAFAWEMNNKDLPWSVVQSGSTPEDFTKAWQHIHDVFAQEQVTNVKWIFDPNTEDQTSISYDALYPGDKYVDWIGIDGYNWGTTHSWSQWASFSGVFTKSYNHLTQIAPTKPVMIAEVNTTDQGGDKARWYTDMLEKEIPASFPKIKAIIFFNEDKTNTEQVNWNIAVSRESFDALKSAIHTPLYTY